MSWGSCVSEIHYRGQHGVPVYRAGPLLLQTLLTPEMTHQQLPTKEQTLQGRPVFCQLHQVTRNQLFPRSGSFTKYLATNQDFFFYRRNKRKVRKLHNSNYKCKHNFDIILRTKNKGIFIFNT